MKIILSIALVAGALFSSAQNFEKKFRYATPNNLSNRQVRWVDMNNDSLMDVMVSGQAQNETTLVFFKNHGHDSLSTAQSLSTGYQNATVFLTDLNNDNKIDIVASGKDSQGLKNTKIFLNTGDFIFLKKSAIANQSFTELAFADLNNDGIKDLVAGDSSKLYLFENAGGSFILKKDTAITIRSITLFDFDNNGFQDVVFSGYSNSIPTAGVLFLKDNFKILKKSRVYSISGTLASGDLNHDGLFDLIITGKDSTGVSVINTFENKGSSFKNLKRMSGFDSVTAKIADFTSDGKADVAFTAKSNGSNNSWVKTFIGDSVVLESTHMISQDYGDYDDDGDLDMVQLRSDSVIVFNNHLNVINRGPSIVVGSIAVQLYDRIFFYWKKSIDDHTDTTALTYDLAVYDGNSAVKSADFDQQNRYRLLASHGNTGTANYSIQKISGSLSYQIQSIDNSFTVQTKTGGGLCTACADVAAENITTCSPSLKIQLKPHAPKAMWFSFNKGFLGIHDTLSYNTYESDTIFSFNPASNPSCSSIKLFPIIAAGSDTLRLSRNLWNCENSQNVLRVASEWSAVTWKNNKTSSIANGSQQTVTLTVPIVYTAFGSNSFGCKFKEVFNLKISKPTLSVANNQYQIAEGGSVQLVASGGNNYLWSPPEGLSDPTVDSPIASPLSTTTYTVTTKDSLNCTASAAVLVEVMEAGFIPTLFTPNGDGKNDALKIFGLTSASNFRFTIYNREGSIVFDTKEVTTAVSQGWTGITNGHSQPSGTYYWKVEGDNNLGGQITLNGKKSGAFLLVR